MTAVRGRALIRVHPVADRLVLAVPGLAQIRVRVPAIETTVERVVQVAVLPFAGVPVIAMTVTAAVRAAVNLLAAERVLVAVPVVAVVAVLAGARMENVALAAQDPALPLVAKTAALQHALEHARKHVFATVAQTITAPEDIVDYMIQDWFTFEGLNCTINTTEDCNLRCKYCYETAKKSKSIDLNTAYRFIDLIYDSLDNGDDFLGIKGTEDEWLYHGIVWDFIGGDSLIDPALLDKLFTRIVTRNAMMKNPLKRGWRGSISSNGTLFEREDVRRFCEKWHDNLSLGVSIDGCPTIHDMYRVFPDGTGSISTIMKNWEWFRRWFPVESQVTKATCSKASIPYLYDSLRFMHEDLGIRWIHQNFIMEDTGCTEEDYALLDRELEKCVQYVLNHDDELFWSMIDHNKGDTGNFYTEGRCGSGRMPCCAIDGNIYPCFRWLAHTQNGRNGVMCVGNVDEGFIHKENFIAVQNGSIRDNCTKDQKCRDCEFEPECTYCIGGCYAECGDFIRLTHICEITKLICKWSKIYEDAYRKKHSLSEEDRLPWKI